MRILVTGVGGQVGSAVCAVLASRGIEALAPDHRTLDITDAEAVRGMILGASPDAVIHCAAWTKVDQAEDDAERCMRVNADGTRNIALACREIDAKLLYLSTDYVFPGTGEKPWEIDDPTGPLNVYGRSKLAGEQAASALLEKLFLVRTSWVFGPRGHNFVKTMLRLAQTHPVLRVVSDQIGTPCYAPDLARLLCDMIVTERYGRYHATNEGGYISWYDFACEIFRQAGLPVEVIPVTSAEYGLSKAARPLNSRLDTDKLEAAGFARLPDWRDALERMLIEGKGTP